MTTLNTRDFGLLTIEEEQLLSFITPIFGFENLTEFAIISNEEIGEGIFWLQSTQKSDVCFILIDPDVLDIDYCPDFPVELKQSLRMKNGTLECLLIAVVPDEFSKTTVNLKSPIVFAKDSGCAAQIILEEDFPLRHPLFTEERGV